MTKDEKIAKLGKVITDRATVLLGKDKITPDSPEYLGINSALKFTAVKYDEKMADDILDIALTMKKRVPLTIEQLAKKNPQFDRAYLEKALQALSESGLVEFHWENLDGKNPNHEKRWVLDMFVPGSAEIMMINPEQSDIPVFQLAAPLRHTNDDVQDYAAQEIRNAIAFIEEHTGEKWDWKYYFECAKRVNYATKCRLEWLEMSKSPYPQVFGSNLALYTETNYMAISGRLPVFEETDRKIMKLAEKAYKKKKMAANEYRHRAIVWGVQSHFYMDFLVWLLNCWGIVPLTDMLSMDNTKMIAEEDTPENREQAIYDIAMLTEKMIMRNRTHGGYKVLLDDLWEFVNEFNADMVILWEHMSCKALDGMHGLFEERARELGIHLVWVSHDLFDPRVVNRQGVRDQINNYMRTVMGEEPVDPSLEILKDDESW